VCEENPDITIDSTNLAIKPSWFTLDAMPSNLNCPVLVDCNRTYSFNGFTGGEVVLSHQFEIITTSDTVLSTDTSVTVNKTDVSYVKFLCEEIKPWVNPMATLTVLNIIVGGTLHEWDIVLEKTDPEWHTACPSTGLVSKLSY
jgi:hypothetical protein